MFYYLAENKTLEDCNSVHFDGGGKRKGNEV